MEFIIDNYVWFIVGAVILLMTLIGYVAERTDFGHRKVEEIEDKKAKKQERIKKDKEKLKNSSLKLNDVVYENAKDTNNVDEIAAEPIEEINIFDKNIGESNIEEPIQTVEETEPLPEEKTEVSFVDDLTGPLPENLQPMEENLNAPLPEMKIPTVTAEEALVNNSVEVKDEVISEPINIVEDTNITSEPVEEVAITDTNTAPETLNKEENNEEENIWNF